MKLKDISEAKKDDEDFSDLLDKYIDQEKIYSFEGIENLEKVVEAIGYDSLDNFFEDNSGALEAVIEWLRENGNHVSEWKEELKKAISDKE